MPLALGAIAVVLVAFLTTVRFQVAAAVVEVLVVIGLFLHNRRDGLVALWVLWIVAPFIRRLFGLAGPYLNADPLSLSPYLATALLSLGALWETRLDRTTTMVLGAAALGFLIGVPTGAHDLNAMLFAAVAYLSALGALVLGYAEGQSVPDLDRISTRTLTLGRVLVFLGPILAVYAIYQYLVGLPVWDTAWLQSADFATVGSPLVGHVRAWSTLNSPGTLGEVLAMAVLALFLRRFRPPFSFLSFALLIAALGVTFTRAAWVGLVFAALIALAAARRQTTRRVVPLVAAIAALLCVASFAGGATGQALLGRLSTFGSLGTDVSANARLSTSRELIPQAVRRPAGAGLGSAGEASRLSATQTLRATDNGYLSILYQCGPLGFLLVFGAAFTGMARLLRRIRRRRERDVLLVTLLAFQFITMLSGDNLYGIIGVIFWYLLGNGLAEQPTAPVGAVATT